LRRYIDPPGKTSPSLAFQERIARSPEVHNGFEEGARGCRPGARERPERKDFKIKLFADMDAATRPDAIIASSSSGLTMSTMQSACKHPERASSAILSSSSRGAAR